MISADVAFRQCSNAAYVAVQHAPAYLTYRSTVHVSVPALKRDREVIRSVALRTADDVAILHDLPRGREQVAHGFPLPASFDALSDFEITGYGGAHTSLEAHVVYSHPLYFPPPSPSEAHVDVIVVRLQGYHVHYVGDPQANPIHLELEPLPGLMKRRTDLAFKDVFIDPSTFLPTRVTFVGADDRYFQVDYATIEGKWLVNHVVYAETYYLPIRIAHVHATIDATFDQWHFYALPPDKRLQPAPAPVQS